MGEIFTVADLPRYSGWRETEEERQNYEDERRKRELVKEQERQQACKTREAEAASANWYAAMDGRIHEHLKSWLWVAIDERIEQNLKLHFFSGERGVGGAVKGGIFGAVEKICARLREEFKHVTEEQQRSFEAQLAKLKECLLTLTNSAGEMQTQLRDEVKRAIEETVDAFGAEITALERRLKAVPGKLPVAKIWRPESVTYQAEFVCHEGSLWQARQDTAQAPGGSDWACVARAGCDAVTPKIRGVYDVHKTYGRLDIIEYDGSSYLARRDAPGVPGISDGWQLMGRSGRRGATGETGPRGRPGVRGARGEDAPAVVSWTLDRKNYRAVPTMSNGTQGAVLELRGLFEQFVLEVGYMGAGGSD